MEGHFIVTRKKELELELCRRSGSCSLVTARYNGPALHRKSAYRVPFEFEETCYALCEGSRDEAV